MNRPFHDVPPMVQAPLQPADRRVALVVGNGKYVAERDILTNPPNDARALAEKLSKIGFHGVNPQGDDYGVDFSLPGVVPLIDLDLVSLGRALRALEKASRGARQAVIYFAGHGIEVEGQNYLIPTTARLGDIADVKYETHSLARALEAVQGASGLRLVILDACRSNPFHTRLFGTRGGEGGLGFVDPGSTLVFYAAKHGKPALDGIGQTNSPFATALLKHIDTQGVEVMRLFRLVRDEVLRATKSQEPYWYGTHGAEDQFFVAPAPVETHAPPPVEVAASGPVDERTIEHTFWQSVKDTTDPAELIAFLEKFPEGTFAALAFERAKTLIDAVKAPTVLRRLMGRYPSSKLAPRVRRRLAALEWEPLKKSRDVEKLEAFAKEFDGLPEADEAVRRLAVLARKSGVGRHWPIVIGGATALLFAFAIIGRDPGQTPSAPPTTTVATPPQKSVQSDPKAAERQFADLEKTGTAEALRDFARANPSYSQRVSAVIAERERVAREKQEGDAQAAAKAEAERQRAAAEAKRRADEEAERRRLADLSARIARESNREALLKIAADDASQRAAVEQRLAALGYIQIATTAGTVWRQPGKGEAFEDCVTAGATKVCAPRMVVLPKGKYPRGSENGDADEKPVRDVTIDYHLAVGKFEVTFAEWDACAADGGCKHKPEAYWGRGRQPVIHVSWNDINSDYLPWLNGKLRLSGAGAYRLLTEAEWEYAARAGSTTTFSFGNTITKSQAQFSEGSLGSAMQTVDVGSFPPNAWGLLDMHGNVWEWVADCYANSYTAGPTNGSKAPETKDCFRVLRVGSWYSNPRVLRSAFRYWDRPDTRLNDVGFRLARTLSP